MLSLRYAVAKDIDFLVDVERRNYVIEDDNSQILSDLAWSEEDFLLFVRIEGSSLYILEEGPALVGFLGVVKDEDVMEIYRIGLDPVFQGAGLGREAVEEALRRARRRGCEELHALVHERNLPLSCFFRSLGFSSFLESAPYPNGDRPIRFWRSAYGVLPVASR